MMAVAGGPQQRARPPGGRVMVLLDRLQTAAPAGTLPSPLPGSPLRVLLRMYLTRYWRIIALLLALQVVQSAALLYLPTLNADMIDNGVLTADVDAILRIGGVMLAVALLQVTALIGAARCGAYVAIAVGRDVRTAVFNHAQRFSAREYGQIGVPSLITRTVNDVQQVQSLVLSIFTMFTAAPLLAVGGVLLALGQDVPLSGVLLLVVPVLGVAMALIVRRLQPKFRAMQQRADTANQVLREQIAGIRVIRAFTKEDFERRRFAGANDGLRTIAVGAGRTTTLMFPLAATLVNLISVPVVWLGAHRVSADAMQVGALTALLGYLAITLTAVVTATFMLMLVPRAQVCAERIVEVLATEPSVRPPAAPVRRMSRPGHLELRGVSFRYPGAEQPVLSDVDLVASPGRTTAVIGPTGSGKSTLLLLVPRLADASAGQVLVGGEDVRHLDPRLLAESVGYVPQRADLLTGTVASNLRLGRPDASDDELWHALEVAQAKDFVAAMDEGLDAPVLPGGKNLSGGQRQRLAIARALVLRPRIYLLDGAFSALDATTSALLRAAFTREVATATVVMTSQSVHTIRHADRIVVLAAGAVVDAGTHHELIARTGVYQEIALSQAEEETGWKEGSAV